MSDIRLHEAKIHLRTLKSNGVPAPSRQLHCRSPRASARVASNGMSPFRNYPSSETTVLADL
jgi:hypothetical protein